MSRQARRMITWLHAGLADEPFPPADRAWQEPNGLLAAGGDLSLPRLLRAYRGGIFPWYEAGQPILWWSPNPRTVLEPAALRLSRSLRKSIRNGGFEISFDRDFEAVVRACGGPRAGATGTWITVEMRHAYLRLHRAGHAHSLEVWQDGTLVGGLYGIAMGRLFCGESMFSHVRDASKVALAWLCRHMVSWEWPLIDSQTPTPHMLAMGAREIPRDRFLERIRTLVDQDPGPDSWQLDPQIHPLDDGWRYPKASA
ncbi:Leucyl/phenylalanyl-tRNA--protein transferase [Thioalkalivibrio nitratireducens DSM 14787]|uniref:Leucyl/phenylalanyl-tRNA--protein transferase n=1 Tax=Thioalkalivibrio nitratireducens (strain DSM 14787 / UNIQEM 213 / ALEN2) TaxID=1255043 RepID=L0DY89_THIND|nr:leucyl/phenylalanyl-tRNA--protein transferase [Thioalkalivibrio nitratireducens]AGA34569.1 Leucyl/phenylalanyl-tRNA--protein transferase [Thioalkalivibrio nitratireducens DSM 14787]